MPYRKAKLTPPKKPKLRYKVLAARMILKTSWITLCVVLPLAINIAPWAVASLVTDAATQGLMVFLSIFVHFFTIGVLVFEYGDNAIAKFQRLQKHLRSLASKDLYEDP